MIRAALTFARDFHAAIAEGLGLALDMRYPMQGVERATAAADALADAEAEQEVSEPRPYMHYECMACGAKWSDDDGDHDCPAAEAQHIQASDGEVCPACVAKELEDEKLLADEGDEPADWSPFNEDGKLRDDLGFHRMGALKDEPPLTQDELIALRGLIQERYEDGESPAAEGLRIANESIRRVARIIKDASEECSVCGQMYSRGGVCLHCAFDIPDPSSTASAGTDDSPGEVSDPPLSPSPGLPTSATDFAGAMYPMHTKRHHQ